MRLGRAAEFGRADAQHAKEAERRLDQRSPDLRGGERRGSQVNSAVAQGGVRPVTSGGRFPRLREFPFLPHEPHFSQLRRRDARKKESRERSPKRRHSPRHNTS